MSADTSSHVSAQTGSVQTGIYCGFYFGVQKPVIGFCCSFLLW